MDLAIELATTESDDSSPLLDAEVSESDDAHAIGLKLQNTISNVLSETLNLLDTATGSRCRGRPTSLSLSLYLWCGLIGESRRWI